MISDLIDLISDLIITLIIGGGLILMILFIFKKFFQKKRNKKALKQIESIELKLKKIGRGSWRIFLMIVLMVFCTIVAIALKPIIYKLNAPFGEGYATFASYMIAICLWMILRPKTTIGDSK